MRVLRGYNADVMDFVAKRMPPMFGESIREAGRFVGFGVIDESGTMQAGIIYNEYQPQFSNIMVHLAADTPRWATHGIIKEILGYAFVEIGLHKVWGSTPNHLTRVLRFNSGIGFRQEGVIRDHYGPGRHAVVTGMLAKEYRKFYIDNGCVQALRQHRAKMRPLMEMKEAA